MCHHTHSHRYEVLQSMTKIKMDNLILILPAACFLDLAYQQCFYCHCVRMFLSVQCATTRLLHSMKVQRKQQKVYLCSVSTMSEGKIGIASFRVLIECWFFEMSLQMMRDMIAVAWIFLGFLVGATTNNLHRLWYAFSFCNDLPCVRKYAVCHLADTATATKAMIIFSFNLAICNRMKKK